MQRLITILRLLLLLTMTVVGLCLLRQLHALNQTLDCIHLRQEQVLQEHQQFLDEHTRRMERYGER